MKTLSFTEPTWNFISQKLKSSLHPTDHGLLDLIESSTVVYRDSKDTTTSIPCDLTDDQYSLLMNVLYYYSRAIYERMLQEATKGNPRTR